MFRFLFLPIRLYIEAGSEAGSGSGTPPPPSPSATPAASTPASGGTPAPSPSATPNPSKPANQQTPAASTPADDLQDGNWRELRTRYESQKAEIAQLKANSNPQAAALITTAQSQAKALGYSEQDFAEAFTKDAVRTLEILREEAAASAAPKPKDGAPDLAQQVRDMVTQQLTPIQEAQNRQATEVAMSKYESTLSELMAADPILKGAPDEVTSLVKDYLGEFFSSQPGILLAMKQKGDFSAVPDAVKFVSGRLHSAFKAWLTKTQPGSTGPTPNQGPAPKGGKFSLDDIINDPGVLGPQYKAQ